MADSSSPTPDVLALVTDLIFASRISAEARAAGIGVVILRSPAKLAEISARLLLVDLNLPGAIAAAAAWGRSPGRQVVGFVSHIDTAAISAAREAGLTQVLARSQFVQQVPALLQSISATRPQ